MSGRQNCQVYDIGDVIILAAVRHDKTSVQGHAAGYLYPRRKEDVHPSSAHAAPPRTSLRVRPSAQKRKPNVSSRDIEHFNTDPTK